MTDGLDRPSPGSAGPGRGRGGHRASPPSPVGSARTSAGSVLGAAVLHHRLGSRQAGYRHPVWAAGDVVQPQLVTELDRLRVTAVLATDPDLQIRACCPALLNADGHEPTDPVPIDGLEGVATQNPALQVTDDELGLSIVPGEAEGG